MNEDTLKGRFHELKGQLKARWGRLTEDDLARIEGHAEELGGVLQRRYGIARDQAESDGKGFLEQLRLRTEARRAERRRTVPARHAGRGRALAE